MFYLIICCFIFLNVTLILLCIVLLFSLVLSPFIVLIFSLLCCLLLLLICCYRYGPKLFFKRWKWTLKTHINEQSDLFTNIASMIPSEVQVIVLEEKALVYLKDIKEAFSRRFNYEIRFMTSGCIPERFVVPLVFDWIGNNDEICIVLSEHFGVKASYSSQSYTIEIVQSESSIGEGYANLIIGESLARRYNLKQGFYQLIQSKIQS